MDMKRIAVLISGSGSNLKNLIEKCNKDLKESALIALVFSNVTNAKGLDIARENGIPTFTIQSPKVQGSISHKNIAEYNKFISMYEDLTIAFERLRQELEKLEFQYSLKELFLDLLANKDYILSNKDHIEENIKDIVFQKVITQNNKDEEKLDDMLYGLIEEFELIANIFPLIKENSSFISFFEREEYDQKLHAILAENKIDYILLAGFMRILSPNFTKKWEGKILNIHPSLLPSFGGAKAVKEALEYGVKVTGCTVHFVSSGVDNGKIITQIAVPVLNNDTIETLHERIKMAEREAYANALEYLINSNI